MATRIYVGSLADTTTEDELKQLFATHGTVASVQVIMDRDTNKSKGFAFVEMENDDEAQAAIKALDGTDVGGRTVVVNVARPKVER